MGFDHSMALDGSFMKLKRSHLCGRLSILGVTWLIYARIRLQWPGKEYWADSEKVISSELRFDAGAQPGHFPLDHS